MPFYRKLQSLQSSHKLHANVIAVMPDSDKPAEIDLRNVGLNIQSIPGVPLREIFVSGTPNAACKGIRAALTVSPHSGVPDENKFDWHA